MEQIQRLAKEWTLGCVNPASRLPLAAGGASSRNLWPVFSPSPVINDERREGEDGERRDDDDDNR